MSITGSWPAISGSDHRSSRKIFVLVKSIDNQYDPGNFGKSRVTERMRHHIAVLIESQQGNALVSDFQQPNLKSF